MPTRPTSSGPTAGWRASTTPTSTSTPGPRSGSRRSPRPTTCCRIPSCVAATTPSARTSDASLPTRIRPPGAKPGRTPTPVQGRAAAGRRGRARREVSEQATSATTSTSRTCSGESSAAGGGAVGAGPAGDQARSRAPTTRPRWRCPSRRPTTAPSAASRSAAPTALARSTSPSRRAWSTVSGSGCAARAARAAVRRQPETSTWWSGSPTTRATGSRVATCTRSCRSLRGRPPWALRSPSTLPEAPPR